MEKRYPMQNGESKRSQEICDGRNTWTPGQADFCVPDHIRWPGVTSPGSVSDALISQIDLMAMDLTSPLLILGQLPAGQAEDSLNMMPVVREGSAMPS